MRLDVWMMCGVILWANFAYCAEQLKPIAPQKDPIPAAEAAGKMTLPEGFAATLFAGEPDIVQPIAFNIDARGRLWVCENFSYPKWQEKCDDRIVILEDTDGDGKHDKKTLFANGFHYLTGVLPVPGGVWVADCPNLYFYPVNEGEDKPAGPPLIHLDGWNWKGQHNVINSLTAGPDGWLYGLNGITVDSLVGVPGTPDDQRVRLNCGVWRYHPVKKKFEHFAEGTTNPWGLDYNAEGQFFISNNVVPHLWHVIQGAHYKRMHGKDFNPHVYGQIDTIADHLHWGGGDWTKSRGGEGIHGTLGGGHSHAGFLLYHGSNFPEAYRGTAFMCNTHGNRLNNDTITRKGSGYVASHRPDFLFSNDKWFHGVTVHQGPDGAIYVSDWSDTGECHHYTNTDLRHGRIYRVTYQGIRRAEVNVAKLSDGDLAASQAGADEWLARRARQEMTYRGAKLNEQAVESLRKTLTSAGDAAHRLRGLWSLHQLGALSEADLLAASKDADAYVRGWSIQLLAEDKQPSAAARGRFVEMAGGDESAVVRLFLAAAMQRTPVAQRWAVLEHLVSRVGDAGDPNLPFMYWYALEPVIGADAKAAAGLLGKIKIPKVREFTVRRMAAR